MEHRTDMWPNGPDPQEADLALQANRLVEAARAQGGDLDLRTASDHLITMGAILRITLSEDLMGRHIIQATHATQAVKALLTYGNPDQQMTAMRYINEVAAVLPFDQGHTPDDIRELWSGHIASLGLEPGRPEAYEYYDASWPDEPTDDRLLSTSEQLASWYVGDEDIPECVLGEDREYYLHVTRSLIAYKIQEGSRRLYAV